MNRKAQAEVITTVLIILLVLAAIVIVWQVVSGTIQKGGSQIEAQSSCIGVTMEVTKAVAGATTVTVRRGQGDSKIKVTGCKVFVDGTKQTNGCTGTLNPLDTQSIIVDASLALDKPISVAAVIGDTVCSPSSDYKVTAS